MIRLDKIFTALNYCDLVREKFNFCRISAPASRTELNNGER